MVVIRLSRGGTNKRPFYQLVVADHRKKRDGRFIEQVGTYNPTPQGKESSIVLRKDRIQHWMAVGAKPSPRVQHLLKLSEKSQPSASE